MCLLANDSKNCNVNIVSLEDQDTGSHGNTPPVTCPAKTPSPWLYPKTETRGHDERIYIVGLVSPNREGKFPQIQI